MQIAHPTSQHAPKFSRASPGKSKPLVTAHRCLAMAAAIAASNWCAAQEAALTPPAPRDTVTLQSGYFSSDYANNVDYAQLVLEQTRGTERLALSTYEKYKDKLDRPRTRVAYLGGQL